MAVHLLPGPFTVETYHRLAELGILGEDDRVELLDGQIVEMSPIGPRHAGCVNGLAQMLMRLLERRAIVAVQNPVVLNSTREPEPDLAVLRPRSDAYRGAHPRPNDVFLLIEVAETSLEHDREVKLPRYAAAVIPEVWLIDLNSDIVSVCRDPGPDGYRQTSTARRGDALRLLHFPDAELSVDEILG